MSDFLSGSNLRWTFANGLTRIVGSLAKAKRDFSAKISYPFSRDGGGATAWSVGGVGIDVTPPGLLAFTCIDYKE
jgi:hypothetical protein